MVCPSQRVLLLLLFGGGGVGGVVDVVLMCVVVEWHFQQSSVLVSIPLGY